jgi:glutamate formiminotransferase
VVEEIVRTVRQIDGVTLLDYSRDETHNRSVVTFAGSAEPVVKAATAAVGRALELIDMEQQTGAHPRIGAVDVVPFVPLGTTRMEECVDLARRFGEQIARTFDLPVYLYGEAALRPDRRRLADVRRGQYEGLRDEIATRGREPDFGPARTHPRGGATCVGARPFLIAWNVNLASGNLELAKRIAHRIRESSGGLPAVQAKGFFIEELGCAQVSMNLLDFGRTPLWAAWEMVRAEAAEDGVELAESELIGLAPLAAFMAVADRAGASLAAPAEERVLAAGRFLKLRDASPLMALELRLARASGG